MKNFLYTLFASALCCVILMSCHDEEVTPPQMPSIIKVYLTKAEFKARLIPLDNGSSRFSILDDAMKRKVDSVLCLGGLGPNRLNILQDADEANIDRAFSASVEQVERELSAMNLLGSLCVYSRELQQYRADSTLELCYQKLFGEEKYMTMLGLGNQSGFPEDTKYADDFIEEFGEPDPMQDFGLARTIEAEVQFVLYDFSDFEGGRLMVYTADPYSSKACILATQTITSDSMSIAFEIPKNQNFLYFLVMRRDGFSSYKHVYIVDGKCHVQFGGNPEDDEY